MRGMTDEQIWKCSFVENELAEAFNVATDGFVDNLEYRVDGAEEFVVIGLVGSKGRYESLAANVTADSKWAILKDVLRAVAARYE